MLSVIDKKRFNDKNTEKANSFEIGDTIDDNCGLFYGVITEEDIKALQNGKVLVFSIYDEYKFAIKLKDY